MTKQDSLPVPAYEPHTVEVLRRFAVIGHCPRDLRPDNIISSRQTAESAYDDLMRNYDLVHRETSVAVADGTSLPVAIFTLPAGAEPTRKLTGGLPLFFSIHGGGLISGCRYDGVDSAAAWLAEFGGVIVSVEYRLAPEFQAPTQLEDCYQALCWAVEHAEELGANAEKLIVCGQSAGGGLAASVTLAARDRKGPKILGSLLDYPMLDDRCDSCSAKQFSSQGIWPNKENLIAWDAVLGSRRGTDQVSYLEAPARAQWLGDLPPIYLDVASCEVFRDEVISFASRIWAAGGDAELHVRSGGTHAQDFVSPASEIGRGMAWSHSAWLRRMLDPVPVSETVQMISASGVYPGFDQA